MTRAEVKREGDTIYVGTLEPFEAIALTLSEAMEVSEKILTLVMPEIVDGTI